MPQAAWVLAWVLAWHLALKLFHSKKYIYLRKKNRLICLFYFLYYWNSLTLVFPRKLVMHPIAAWKELYNPDTDPQISTSKQTSCAKHTFGFLHHRHRRNERHTKATSEATTPFLVGSTQWLWYLHSIGLGRKSQSPGGTYLPHLIRESSRMKGSEWQKFRLPHYVPIQTSLSEGPLQRAAPR